MADRIDEVEQAVSNVTITTDDTLSDTSSNPIQNQAVAKALVTKQEKLVDGVNVKTINGKSILGSGNLALDADFTFVAAFDTSLNDTTTTSEKSANKTNASLYYQSIQNGIKPKVALKFSFRDSSSEVPVEVVPSFIGMVSMYNGKYQNSYGANAMVFAKLDIGDRFAGLTFDLIMDPDIGSVLIPHIDASEINILHARVVDNAITSDGLSSLLLKQNQELYKYALSAPVAVYVSNTRQLISAKISQGSGFLAVYAGDYVFEFYEDGTIVDHPIQKDEVATVEYVNEEVAKKVDKVEGKQLSTEDFTTDLKNKLEAIPDTLPFVHIISNTDTYTWEFAEDSEIKDFANLTGAVLYGDAKKYAKVVTITSYPGNAVKIVEAVNIPDDGSNYWNLHELILYEDYSFEVNVQHQFLSAAYDENKIVIASVLLKLDNLEESKVVSVSIPNNLEEELSEINNTIIENEEITAAALNELNERVVTPYEYYKEKGGVVSESAYNIMTKYLFTPFIISNNSTTTIPDELLNESQTSFFTDYYWNFMRLTGGEPIRTTQWANNIPQKLVGISSGLSFVIDFSNKTITPEQ